MMHLSRILLPALFLAAGGILTVTPARAADVLSETAERHCRSAGIGGLQLEECARAVITDTEQLAEASDERVREAGAAIRRGDLAGAEKQLLALTSAEAHGAGLDRKDLVLVYAALGALHAAGRETAAIDFYEKARALGSGDISDTFHLALIHDRQDDLARAQALYQSVADASYADEKEGKFWQARAFQGLGKIAAKRNQASEAEAYYKHALELFTGLGRRGGVAEVNASLGYLAMKRGQFDEARSRLARALSYYEEIGKKEAVAGMSVNLGATELHSGKFVVAETHYRRALKIYQELDNKQGQLAAHFNLGTVSTHLKRFEDAEYHNLEALKLAEELKIPPLEVVILLNIGVMHDKRGNMAEACRRYEQAADKMTAAAVPDEKNTARKIHRARCESQNQQVNRGPGGAKPVSQKSDDLPEHIVVIDDGGRVVALDEMSRRP